MATGDRADCVNRVMMTLPSRWFADSSPVLVAVLNGIGYGLSLCYALIQYAKNQTRIASASDGFLDLIASDFFGTALPRRTAEQDAPFRQRILANLLREKGTRKGMIAVLTTLTGRAPVIVEPWRIADTGAYGKNNGGYGVAGAYGSLIHNNQAFVTAFRPSASGIPNIAGYGASTGAYGTASQSEYANMSMILGAVTDADIFAAMDATKPAGSIVWARLSN